MSSSYSEWLGQLATDALAHAASLIINSRSKQVEDAHLHQLNAQSSQVTFPERPEDVVASLDGAQGGELAMAHVEELSQMRDQREVSFAETLDQRASGKDEADEGVRSLSSGSSERHVTGNSRRRLWRADAARRQCVALRCCTSDHPISPAPAVIVHVSQAQPHGVETMPLSRVGGSQSVASGFQYAYSEHKTAKPRLEF
ncbi:conserved hypothetical protein [Coccidioides posadasii str. Silveira]|uniref:Uncharacterized protein n=1 Tax=Coccidioides posadasii (strain RMSCC 757 / Silveira) TaxID=443226 RepID=E9CY80_COCPS|nr:conserved hypothetical protein [Coccidioides posadasii str. Silveira]